MYIHNGNRESTWPLHIMTVIRSTVPIKGHVKSYILTLTQTHTHINYSIHTNKYTFEQFSKQNSLLSLLLFLLQLWKTRLMVE